MELEKLGRYVIEDVLGRGAMGVVYLARDPVIGRRLALKTLTAPADSDDADEFAQRFLREAQAAGILNHPGIVTVHDAGADDTTGLGFIAMEYIEGKSLKDLLRGGHMFAYSEVARIGAALAGALDYAHANGVVHRDIKPANIILTPQGNVKITDFGVARLESSNLTATGQFIGTPNYMSPEQITGGIVDGRSDLFSLGVVLFELLTGGRPFLGGSLTEVTYKIVHEPAPIPSQQRAGLPPAFNPIILKLLEKDASKRYQRGAEVARALEALRRVLSGMAGEVTAYAPPPEPSAAKPASSMEVAPTATRATQVAPGAAQAADDPPAPPFWKWPIEARWVVALLSAVVTPFLVATILLAVRIPADPGGPPAGEPGRRHRVAEGQRQAEAALREGRPDEAERLLSDVLEQAPYSSVARDLKARAAGMRTNLADQQSRQSRAQLLREEGWGLSKQGRFREAQARFEEALELTPDDALTREYLEYVRERGRSARAGRPEPAVPASARVLPASRQVGESRVEVYFNSPLPAGTVEIEVDGSPRSSLPFNFYQKSFLGIRKKGTGIVANPVTVPSGTHEVLVRVRDEDGRPHGEQTFSKTFAADGRYSLKIEMPAGAAGAAEFSLIPLRSR